MKYARSLVLGLGVLTSVSLLAVVVFAEGEIVTTLLPKAAPGSEPLKVSADGSDPIKSTNTASLSFDLSLIPQSATIKKVILRFVGASAKIPVNPQLVNIFPEGSAKSVASWTATSDKSVFQASTEPLQKLVEDTLKAGKALSLTFSSKSRLSDWQYSSMTAYGGISANKPRLIIEYQPSQALRDRAQEGDTTRTRWKFSHPEDAANKPFLDTMTAIISNPVFYDGGMYLFAKPSSGETKLYALKLGGGNRWEPKAIQITPGSHALVSPVGRLYSAGEERLVIYDLKQEGAEIRNVSIPNFKPALRPTLGEDGSLYAMPPGAIFSFNPDPLEVWRYPSGKAELTEASRVALSPDASRYAYALTKKGTVTQIVRIETATGSSDVYTLPLVDVEKDGTTTKLNLDLGFTRYSRPVVSKGPQQDYVFFSAATTQSGLLLAHSGGEIVWWKEGEVSQPIVNKDNNIVAVQSGKLHIYAQLNGKDDGTDPEKKSCTSGDSNLGATSNLVLDGEDNVYFWNNGALLGYTKSCRSFLNRPLPGLPETLELLFAPDGTLFARSTATNQLHTIMLMPREGPMTLAQDTLQTDTIYSAKTITVAANLQVESAMNVFLKAQKQISFGQDFTVKQGATLRCQVGW